MGYAGESSDDMDKLRQAFSELTSAFGSVENILDAFGLANMPVAQRYGIFFGCVVFALTITAVLCLLSFGGTFKRLSEQTDSPSTLSASDARSQRSLLLERLLEGRDRMMRAYSKTKKIEEETPLVKMLLNVKPPESKSQNAVYEENYVVAYRTCQDRPGGSILSGRPEARFEAYARGYAGCGPHASMAYRRSYGRVYEATCCASLKADTEFCQLFQERPEDIVGRYVRLEALSVNRHLQAMHKMTSGVPALDSKAFNPNEIWGFLSEGPFKNTEELRQSFVFQREETAAGFGIVNNVTGKLVGAILLNNDSPENLSIQLEPPIMQLIHLQDGSRDQLESCFLLLDRLFGHGYRRIQIAVDSQDSLSRKLASRLGFTLEGILYKHMVVKEASRDSNVYGMLNSDWTRGARASLFGKLYGKAAAKADMANEKREEEHDEQSRVLAQQKEQEEGIIDGKKEK